MATLTRPLSAAEAAALVKEVTSAVERGQCSTLVLPRLHSDEARHLVQRAEQFQRQCQFLFSYGLESHPCVTLSGEAIPLSFSPEEMHPVIVSAGGNPEGAIASTLSQAHGTNVEMVHIEQVKKTFAQRFVEFLGVVLEWVGIGGGGRGNDGGDDMASYGETGGLEITVNSNTHGLQVVYSEHFMIRGKRSENAFGETLTSPVKGQITQPGLYYFGTADNVETKWARFTFRIPPTRTVNLMH